MIWLSAIILVMSGFQAVATSSEEKLCNQILFHQLGIVYLSHQRDDDNLQTFPDLEKEEVDAIGQNYTQIYREFIEQAGGLETVVRR